MRLSLAYEMQRPVVDDHAVIEETIEQCVLADRMGFDTVWFVEHHFLTSFSMSPCPEVIFGALSRLTKRIRGVYALRNVSMNLTVSGFFSPPASSNRSPAPPT